MPSVALSDYVRLLSAMPGTPGEIGQKCGMTTEKVRQVCRSFWRLNLCHPGGRAGNPRNYEAVWLIGDGDAVDGIRAHMIARSNAAHIAFASLWREFEIGASAHEAASNTGVNRRTVYKVLDAMRECGVVHICGWERNEYGRAYAMWQLGEGKNVRKPKPKSDAEINRDVRERKRLERVRMLGAANSSHAEEERAA